MPETLVPGLERRLKAQLLGEVAFDAFARGRYATDASHDQIMLDRRGGIAHLQSAPVARPSRAGRRFRHSAANACNAEARGGHIRSPAYGI